MDVIFEISKVRQFSIEVGFFDTVLEMKEKIQKYEGFPVDRQTLVFNGKIMSDDRDTEYYEVVQGSRILLIIKPELGKPAKLDDSSQVQVIINILISKRQISVGVNTSETVMQLKDRIQELEGIPSSQSMLFVGNVEMEDEHALAEYGVMDGTEVSAITRPLFPPVSAVGSSKRLRLLVLPKHATNKIPVEVNASDNVSELRKELQRLQPHLHFHLPAVDYFFIYKQNVMDEDRTFRWHDVQQGDTIEVFNGSVTGGS